MSDRYAEEDERLASLVAELRELGHGADVLLIRDEAGRPCVEVADFRARRRRVYAHLGFFWFYWGDQENERASLLRVADAARFIDREATAGWPEGPQGDLRIVIGHGAALGPGRS